MPPDNLFCFEKIGDMCGIYDKPFEAVLKPFQAVFTVGTADLTLVAIWGILLGIVWLRTSNLMLVSILGVLVSSSLTAIFEPARGIGLILVGVSVGITLFQLIRHKIQTFA